MKTDLRWGGSSVTKARIWLDSLPDCAYEANEVLQKHRAAQQAHVLETRVIAVELFLPIGPKTRNGLLGASFVPDASEQLIVQVPFSVDEGRPYRDMLVGKLDSVYVGLPREYVGGVLDGALGANDVSPLSAGTLRFCCAAHGLIGSSPWVFRVLGSVIVRLLGMDPQALSEERLLTVLLSEMGF